MKRWRDNKSAASHPEQISWRSDIHSLSVKSFEAVSSERWHADFTQLNKVIVIMMSVSLMQVHLLRTAGDEVTITVRYLREAPAFLKLPLGEDRFTSPGNSDVKHCDVSDAQHST